MFDFDFHELDKDDFQTDFSSTKGDASMQSAETNGNLVAAEMTISCDVEQRTTTRPLTQKDKQKLKAADARTNSMRLKLKSLAIKPEGPLSQKEKLFLESIEAGSKGNIKLSRDKLLEVFRIEFYEDMAREGSKIAKEVFAQTIEQKTLATRLMEYDQLMLEANDAVGAGDNDLATSKVRDATRLSCSNALLYSRRAASLLEQQQVPAAIEDCNAALALNSFCGTAHKVRGRAFAMQEKWEAAHIDLSKGLAIDYDESTAELARSAAEKVKQIREYLKWSGRARTMQAGQHDPPRSVYRSMGSLRQRRETHGVMPLSGGLKAAAAAKLLAVDLPWVGQTATTVPSFCFVVENVLNLNEVKSLSDWFERENSESNWLWLQTMGHLQAPCHNPALACELWERLRPFAPAFNDKHVVGLNDNLRFLKYSPGHFFPPHEDSAHTHTQEDGTWAHSYLSVLLYLSDPEEGTGRGSTRFIAPDCPECARSGRCDAECEYCVDAPVRRGSVLFFTHSIRHAGTELTQSEKFVMRSDLFYGDD